MGPRHDILIGRLDRVASCQYYHRHEVRGFRYIKYVNSHSNFEIPFMWRELRQIRAPNSVPSPGSDIWEIQFDVNPECGSLAS